MVNATAALGLGPVLVEKKYSKAGGVFLLAVGLLFLAGSMALFSENAFEAAGVFVLAAGFVWLGITLVTKRYELRQNGVSMRSAFGTNAIAFSNVRTIGYAVVRSGANKRVTLALIPTTGKTLNVSLGVPLQQADEPDLAALRDRLSQEVATKMEEVLKRRGTVEWIQRGSLGAISFPTLMIIRDGFTIDDGRAKSIVLTSEVNSDINNGYFFMTRKLDKKKLFSCPASAANFYPGLQLLQRIRATG
jgi:hypothetical protein